MEKEEEEEVEEDEDEEEQQVEEVAIRHMLVFHHPNIIPVDFSLHTWYLLFLSTTVS